MESHPAMKKLGIFQRPQSASLGDTPKNPAKGEKRSASSPPLEKTAKRGKGGSLPSYAQVATSQPLNEEGDWRVVIKKKGERKEEVLLVLKKGGDVLAFRKELDTMVPLMLQSERFWTLIESFVTLVIKTRELDGRRERSNGEGQ